MFCGGEFLTTPRVWQLSYIARTARPPIGTSRSAACHSHRLGVLGSVALRPLGRPRRRERRAAPAAIGRCSGGALAARAGSACRRTNRSRCLTTSSRTPRPQSGSAAPSSNLAWSVAEEEGNRQGGVGGLGDGIGEASTAHCRRKI